MSQVNDCLAVIKKAASGFVPQVGMVLGSGLGTFADQVNAIASISFDDLPGFPQAGVGGHAGRLVLGHVSGTRIAVLQGRAHYYEHGQADVMAVAIQTFKALGCEALILTNAAGSMSSQAILDWGFIARTSQLLHSITQLVFLSNSMQSWKQIHDFYT